MVREIVRSLPEVLIIVQVIANRSGANNATIPFMQLIAEIQNCIPNHRDNLAGAVMWGP
jgi:hypothetical protein